jgi:PAS domain S-box-containing protein
MTAAVSRRQFSRILVRTLAPPLVLIALCPILFLWFGLRLEATLRAETHATEVIASAFRIEKLLIDLETGVRGYQINREEVFLQPYTAANAEIEPQLQALERLVADDPVQLRQAELIHRDHDVWKGHALEAIQRARTGGPPDVSFNAEGKAIMDRIRSDIAAFLDVERQKGYEEGLRASSLRTATLVWTFGGFLAAAVGTAFWVANQVRVIRRYYAEILAETEQQKESVEVILASIGDAVIVTDKDGRISFINGEAQRLTGWKGAEAIGQPLKTVFRIINEESREPAEDPVEKVHREMRVVGLANHTALLSSTGAEWLIEDSAAPILDREKAIQGVVLVFQDATEKRRAQREVRHARDQALAASQAKDTFLAALSHELRTPLNPALLLATEAADNPDLPAEVRADFETIAKNISIEARLIDDLLDLTSVSRGKMTFDMRPIDLRVAIAEAVDKVRGDIQESGLSLETDLGTVPLSARADGARIQQVIWNLLRNSAKFTPSGGRVSLRAGRSADGRSAEITVVDTGIGMTPAEIERVFKFFAQGDHATASGRQRFGGLGLGLAISRMIVDAHQGAITVVSEGSGKGCTFTVRFPLAGTDEPAPV